jgi:hypothetical protein
MFLVQHYQPEAGAVSLYNSRIRRFTGHIFKSTARRSRAEVIDTLRTESDGAAQVKDQRNVHRSCSVHIRAWRQDTMAVKDGSNAGPLKLCVHEPRSKVVEHVDDRPQRNMSHKRKREEVTDAGHDRSEPSKQTTLKPGKTSFKPRGRGAYTSNAEPKTNATNALKNRIRSLRRLLEHVDNVPKHKMPANVRIERDRELEACEHELAEKTAAGREAELRNKMIGKYHQVRFFGKCAPSAGARLADIFQIARKPQEHLSD